MRQDFDAIVIGSGFGGAITACRLAEKGMKVLILERGRRWAAKDYPRKAGDAWVFNCARTGPAQRLAGSAVLQEHDGGPGRGRRRRLARLQQRCLEANPIRLPKGGPPKSPTPS